MTSTCFEHPKYASLKAFVEHYAQMFSDVKNWDKAHINVLDRGGRSFIVASYHGYPVMGYIHASPYCSEIVLHKYGFLNSFNGSVAQNGDWIKISALDGLCIVGSEERCREVYNHFKKMADGNKAAKAKRHDGWQVSYRLGDSLIKEGYIQFGLETAKSDPAAFKKDILERRRVLAKYEKEFGKVS